MIASGNTQTECCCLGKQSDSMWGQSLLCCTLSIDVSSTLFQPLPQSPNTIFWLLKLPSVETQANPILSLPTLLLSSNYLSN